MAWVRRLFWLGVLVALSYLVWRWRRQQAEGDAPIYTPATSTFALRSNAEPLAPPAAAAEPEPADLQAAARQPNTPLPTAASDALTVSAPSEPSPDLAEALATETAGSAAQFDDDPTIAPSADEELAPGVMVDTSEAMGEPPLVGEVVLQPNAELSTAEQGDEEAAGGLLDINNADEDSLIALPGIGPALARRIIAYRVENGPFSSIEQLIDIPGIGTKNIDEFRHLVTV